MTQEDQVFIANVVVINSTQETVVLNIINQPVGANAELSAIIKIHKHKGLHEGHHFILMAMEVHSAPKVHFLSHMVEVQLPYLNYQFYNTKTFTYLASKIGEVLDNELFNSYIKRLVIGIFTNR
jgi:hypothetical protein